MLFSELDAAIKQLTGQEIKVHVIHGKGIRAVITDFEVAEVQGAADWLLQKNLNHPESPLKEFDPLVLIQYLIKLCRVHGQR